MQSDLHLTTKAQPDVRVSYSSDSQFNRESAEADEEEASNQK